MNKSAYIGFRTSDIVQAKAGAVAHDNGMCYSELLRFALSYGIQNAENVSKTKRDDITLEQALTLQACGADFT